MNWITIIRRAVGVLLVLPVLVLVFNPMVEILRRTTPNMLLIMLVIAVYVALCIWGLLAWRNRLKK
ncbi:MAG: hypothetical protein HYY45_12720 [Deltaproteobacteria bacterium]|nr:hypothetical protein [Deltaproteobacteria bacterium]